MLFLIVCSGILCSCRKGPGPGGKGTIKGKIYEYNYNKDFTSLQGEYYKGDHDVYIVYGDDSFYSDKISTHYDGSFQFEYLLPGSYTVYTYSQDNTLTTPGSIVVDKVTELSKKEEKDIGTLYVYDN